MTREEARPPRGARLNRKESGGSPWGWAAVLDSSRDGRACQPARGYGRCTPPATPAVTPPVTPPATPVTPRPPPTAPVAAPATPAPAAALPATPCPPPAFNAPWLSTCDPTFAFPAIPAASDRTSSSEARAASLLST